MISWHRVVVSISNPINISFNLNRHIGLMVFSAMGKLFTLKLAIADLFINTQYARHTKLYYCTQKPYAFMTKKKALLAKRNHTTPSFYKFDSNLIIGTGTRQNIPSEHEGDKEAINYGFTPTAPCHLSLSIIVLQIADVTIPQYFVVPIYTSPYEPYEDETDDQLSTNGILNSISIFYRFSS